MLVIVLRAADEEGWKAAPPSKGNDSPSAAGRANPVAFVRFVVAAAAGALAFLTATRSSRPGLG